MYYKFTFPNKFTKYFSLIKTFIALFMRLNAEDIMVLAAASLKYVLEDIGTRHFMNYGIRNGFGPCLLDYPYLYEVDGNKLQCKEELSNGSICNGYIDYDDGANALYCQKCGREYSASSLKKYIEKGDILVINEDVDYNLISRMEFVIKDETGRILAEKKKQSDIII